MLKDYFLEFGMVLSVIIAIKKIKDIVKEYNQKVETLFTTHSLFS